MRPAPEPVRAFLRLYGMRLVLRTVVPLVLVFLGLAVAATPAGALSCIDPESATGRADHVFTGRITDARASRIDVTVKEIWQGGPLERRVSLDTELDGWWDNLENGNIPEGYTSTSDWLFASRTNKAGRQVVSPCTAWPTTTPWDTDLRPLSVMPPLSDDVVSTALSAGPAKHTTQPEDGANLLVRGVAGLLVVGTVGGAVLLARGRRG